jgi:hypothetical protein
MPHSELSGDTIEQALAISADDPDGEHPAWVQRALRIAATEPGWATNRMHMPSLDATSNEPAAEQMQMDLFSVTPDPPMASIDDALTTAMGWLDAALKAKGSMPTLDDCHRHRYGLPGSMAFNRAGGWHTVMVLFRSRIGGAA